MSLDMNTESESTIEIFWNPYKDDYCFYVGDIVWRYCEFEECWESIGIVDFMHSKQYKKFYKFICAVRA